MSGFKKYDQKSPFDVTTTNNTPTILLQYTIPTSARVRIQVHVFVEQSTSGEEYGATFYKMVKNLAGTVTAVDTAGGAGAWDDTVGVATSFGGSPPSIVPGITGTDFKVTVTGANANTFKWRAYLTAYLT